MTHLLDNITWHALNGSQSQFAAGTDDVRRYAQGFSPLLGFANPDRPDFSALAPFCEPEEQLFCFGWAGAAPDGWKIDGETVLVKMLWDAEMPANDEVPEAIRLGPEHASQVLELVKLTRPGPFGPRNIELGEFFGCFEGQHLVAMAGERLCAGALREISGVCTHPDFQGRGFARRLMAKLIRREMQRGETPFLQVRPDNISAYRLYERMGFRDRHESVARAISLC